ncbi:MAG: HAD family phosphatase [Kiritimatiellae bacterium]|nr:HAD family phosphatase [Kiritimatiellia bacterium]MCO5067130.1 HAD family phosphatase [Kiritimatiellia bacterium]
MGAPIQYVMFDLGVVLLHLDYAPAQAACISQCDPERLAAGGKFLRLLGRTPIVDAYERGELTAQQFFDHFVAATGFRGSLDEFIAIWRSIFRENTPMIEFAHRVSKRLPTFLMTNASDQHVPWVFDRYRSLNFFRDYAASCYVGAAKPDPVYYQRALNKFGARAEVSLFVDDRPENIDAAQALGFRCVLYENPEQAIGESLKILDFP